MTTAAKLLARKQQRTQSGGVNDLPLGAAFARRPPEYNGADGNTIDKARGRTANRKLG